MNTSEMIAELKKRVAKDYSDNKYDYDDLCGDIDREAMAFDDIKDCKQE